MIGSEGTIGSRLVEKLREKGYQVWGCDIIRKKAPNYTMADITHYETLERIFADIQPKIVFHLAAEVSRETCEHWPTVSVETNVMGTLNVLLLCTKYSARVVYSGTSEEYGDAFQYGKVDEDTPIGNPQGIYALTKYMAETLVEFFHRTRGLSGIVVRLFMCYGREKPTGYRSAVTQFIESARLGETIFVHKGTKRQWSYIDDTVEGLIKAAQYRLDDHGCYETFLLGRSETWEMIDIAKKIRSIVNSKSRIEEIDVPKGITPVKLANFDKSKRLLNWEAKITFDKGIRMEIEWAKKNSPLRDSSSPDLQ